MTPGVRAPRWRIALAWGVHLYTALGLACAAGMAVLIYRGDGASFRGAFWLMLLATLIDATDGALARAVRIKETLPGFDGRRLDDLVDFVTYVCLPLLLIWRAKLVPEGTEAVLLLPLFAAAYGFSQVEAKNAEGYFVGFPSYWNVVAFYLYALQPPGWLGLALVIALSLLTFVPSLYLYPTQKGLANRVTCVLGAAWVVVLVWVLWNLPDDPRADTAPRELTLVSLSYPIYYFILSWLVTLSVWRRKPEGSIVEGRRT
jgi:phosphatidylcholine synthase